MSEVARSPPCKTFNLQPSRGYLPSPSTEYRAVSATDSTPIFRRAFDPPIHQHQQYPSHKSSTNTNTNDICTRYPAPTPTPTISAPKIQHQRYTNTNIMLKKVRYWCTTILSDKYRSSLHALPRPGANRSCQNCYSF